MGHSEWESATDFEAFLRANSCRLTPSQLRLFACECCRRILGICDDPIYLKMLRIAEEIAAGSSLTHDRVVELKPEYDRVYRALYPGYGTPSAATLALVAVGEASRESALDAAISASSTAAEAMASSTALPVDDDHYDEVYEATLRSERRAQSELLKQLAGT